MIKYGCFYSLVFITTINFLLIEESFSLPIGFGRTQGSLNYSELTTDNFYLYHDSDTKSEAKYTLKSLELARPILEEWFGVSRSSPLIVNMSSVTSGASFANFLTDSIELQTMGMIHSSLAWHEYTHALTYARMQDWTGSAATIIHLAWLPSWFLEGLAEAVTVSVGSDIQKGTERFYAMNGSWPSYEKLHKLYDSSFFSTAGYSISGSFVSYIIYKYNINVSTLVKDFYWKSMPWWWPYSLIPFLDSLPLDMVLKKHTGKTAEELYEEYKTWAESTWGSQKAYSHLLNHPLDEVRMDDFTRVRDGKLFYLIKDGSSYYEAGLSTEDLETVKTKKISIKEFVEDPDNKITKSISVPSGKSQRVISKKVQAYVKDKFNKEGFSGQDLYIITPKKSRQVKRRGRISELYRTSHYLWWEENYKDESKICYLSLSTLGKVSCPLKGSEPTRYSIIGNLTGSDSISLSIWVKQVNQKINGKDEIKLHKIVDGPKNITHFDFLYQEPMSIAQNPSDKNIYMLLSSHSSRPIVKFDSSLSCKETYWYSDTYLSIKHLSGSRFVAKALTPSKVIYTKLDLGSTDAEVKDCSTLSRQYPSSLSLITVALNSTKNDISLNEALSIKHNLIYSDVDKLTPESNTLVETLNWGVDAKDLSVDSSTSKVDQQQIDFMQDKPYGWRGRLLFLLPWIGANDYQDYYQLGVVGVPLMDHLQNETVYLTALFGIHSLTPDLSLNITSSRFWPVLNLEIFRTLSWDGWDRYGRSSYMREIGMNFSSTFVIKHWLTMLSLGVHLSDLAPYAFASEHISGTFVQPYITLSHMLKLGRLTTSVSNSFYITSKSIGSDFDYNRWKSSLSFSLPVPLYVRTSRFDLSVDYSRTRGNRTRGLQEYARAVKKFMPGSGDSVNNIYLPMNEGGYLFSVQEGNNQVGVRPSLTIPLIEDLETLIRIFYVGRLDFTAFFSYTGAWFGSFSDISKVSMIKAHGYNLNLNFDVKGVNFSSGFGVGQVIGKKMESFGTFGFSSFL